MRAVRTIDLKDIEIGQDRYDQLLFFLSTLVNESGLSISRDELGLCLDHLLYVCQVNEYINLTRITDLDDAIVLHILDSLLLESYIPDSVERVLDMGTGAGFPGIPLAATTGLDYVLLDSVGKKINAVKAFAEKLQLGNVTAVHSRLEDYALEEPGRFDLVCARALASMPVLVEYATPFLRKGSYLMISKGNPEQSEIDAGNAAASMCGLELVSHDEFDLPRDLGHRSIYLYKSVRAPKVQLPRPSGTAKRTPLA